MLTLCGLVLACTMLLESRALYAPATLPDAPAGVWVGGWRMEADIGPDRIYRLDPETGALTLALARAGAHVNDPSLVHPPSTPGVDRTAWTYLYYTGLDDGDAAAERWTRHWIGLASSVDGGVTWTDHGPIVPGWSPSAVVVRDEVWVYTHDAAVRVWRQRLDANGWTPVGPREPVTGVPLVSNVDVTWWEGEGRYALVANRADFSALVAGVSPDGLHFTVVGEAAPAPGTAVLTPHWGADGRSVWAATTGDVLRGPYQLWEVRW